MDYVVAQRWSLFKVPSPIHFHESLENNQNFSAEHWECGLQEAQNLLYPVGYHVWRNLNFSELVQPLSWKSFACCVFFKGVREI